MHPGGDTGAEAHLRGKGNLGNTIGNPLETTIFVSHLIYEGTLDKFPGVKICCAHAGGYLPSYMGRTDGACVRQPDACSSKKRPVDEYFKTQIMWVDDFWGDAAWEQWEREFAKVMPPPDYIIEDVPLSDPIFHSMFEVKHVPQVSNIRFWRTTGGASTSERGAESAVVHFRAVRDKHRRIVAVMTHNTDISDSWEREGDDPRFFQQFAPDGYALGINVVLYALTH